MDVVNVAGGWLSLYPGGGLSMYPGGSLWRLSM